MSIDKALWALMKENGPDYIDNEQASKIVTLVHEILVLDSITMSNVLIGERLDKIRGYRKILAGLLAMPQVEQRSPEWHSMRRNRLTASDTAAAIGRGKFETRKGLLKKKAFPELSPFVSSYIMKWGTMFEPMANRCYRQRNGDVPVHDFGLIPDPTMSYYGASPDGINEMGVMLELKCPLKRKIDGTIPEQYEIQMQGQMAVCRLEECDYVECGLEEFESVEKYLAMIDPSSKTDHGIVLEYCDSSVMSYDYSPEYMVPEDVWKWAQHLIKTDQRHLVKITPWKLQNYFTQRIYFDKPRWESLTTEITTFWNEVEEMRRNGPDAYIVEKQPSRRRERVNKIIEFIDDNSENDAGSASSG